MSLDTGAATETASRLAARAPQLSRHALVPSTRPRQPDRDHTTTTTASFCRSRSTAAVRLPCRPRGRSRVRSLDVAGTVELPADGSADPASVEPGWGRYVAGVVRALADRGPPLRRYGRGLLRTCDRVRALLECSARDRLRSRARRRRRLAARPDRATQLACRDAEAAAVRVPCGIMDQLARSRDVWARRS